MTIYEYLIAPDIVRRHRAIDDARGRTMALRACKQKPTNQLVR